MNWITVPNPRVDPMKGVFQSKFRRDPDGAFHEMIGLWLSEPEQAGAWSRVRMVAQVGDITFRMVSGEDGYCRFVVWHDSKVLYSCIGEKDRGFEFMADLIDGGWFRALFE